MHGDTDHVLASLVERIADAGGVGSVYGDPIEREDRTVVPVARVAWGFGGGGGAAPDEESDAGDEASDDAEDDAGDEAEAPGSAGAAEGFGAGGGLVASPAGALEITDDGTRFVRYRDSKKLLSLAALAFLVGWLAGRR